MDSDTEYDSDRTTDSREIIDLTLAPASPVYGPMELIVIPDTPPPPPPPSSPPRIYNLRTRRRIDYTETEDAVPAPRVRRRLDFEPLSWPRDFADMRLLGARWMDTEYHLATIATGNYDNSVEHRIRRLWVAKQLERLKNPRGLPEPGVPADGIFNFVQPIKIAQPMDSWQTFKAHLTDIHREYAESF